MDIATNTSHQFQVDTKMESWHPRLNTIAAQNRITLSKLSDRAGDTTLYMRLIGSVESLKAFFTDFYGAHLIDIDETKLASFEEHIVPFESWNAMEADNMIELDIDRLSSIKNEVFVHIRFAGLHVEQLSSKNEVEALHDFCEWCDRHLDRYPQKSLSAKCTDEKIVHIYWQFMGTQIIEES